MIGAIVGAAGAIAGGLIGRRKARKARKKAQRVLDQQKRDNENWYDMRYNEDYTQSATAQSMLNRARQYAEEQYKRAAGAAKVGGATTESVATAQQAGNRMIGDVMGQIAAQGEANRSAVESQYMQNKENIANQQANIYLGAAQASTEAANQMFGAGMGLAGADMQSYLENGQGLFESLFKKKGVS